MKKRFMLFVLLAIIFLILKNNVYAEENNKIKILFYSLPPYHYTTIDGQVHGIWPEIIKECLKDKYQLEFIEANSYDIVYNNIINKKYDIGLSIGEYNNEAHVEKIYPEAVSKSYILWVSSFLKMTDEPYYKDLNKLPYKRFGQINDVTRQGFTDNYKLVKTGGIKYIFHEMDMFRCDFTIADFFEGGIVKYVNKNRHVYPTATVIYRESLYPFTFHENLDTKWEQDFQSELESLSIDPKIQMMWNKVVGKFEEQLYKKQIIINE